MVIKNNIQDLYVDLSGETYREGAISFVHETIIENNDIQIIENQEALFQSIINVLETPLGKIDGVGLEGFGSKLLSLRGINLNYHTVELAKLYINQIIPQLEGRVYSFPNIEITKPSREKREFTMRIRLSVDSIYGKFTRVFYI